MTLAHTLLRTYRNGPDHFGKLRIYDWLRLAPMIRNTRMRTSWGTVDLDLSDWVQHEIFLNQCYEPLTFRAFNTLIRPGSRVIDVGANIGQYALSAARIAGPTGKILAVEPNPLVCQRLIDNRRLNSCQDRIEVVSTAIGLGDRLLDFGIPSSMALGTTRVRTDTSQEAFWTPCIRLSRLIEEFAFDDVDMIKIDVEGADIEIVRSLFEHSPVRPPNILFEYIPGAFEYGLEASRLSGYFSDFGYELTLVTGSPYVEGCEIIESNVLARKT